LEAEPSIVASRADKGQEGRNGTNTSFVYNVRAIMRLMLSPMLLLLPMVMLLFHLFFAVADVVVIPKNAFQSWNVIKAMVRMTYSD